MANWANNPKRGVGHRVGAVYHYKPRATDWDRYELFEMLFLLIGGYDFHEVAEIMGISVHAVRGKWNRLQQPEQRSWWDRIGD